MIQHNFDKKQKVKVIFIAGYGRSGSTLLDNILGQAKDFFSAGELRLWPRRYMKNDFCGCGTPVRECRIWSKIFKTAFGKGTYVDPDALQRIAHQAWRAPSWKHTALMLPPADGKALRRIYKDYLGNLERLYHSISLATHSKVIVDSSKSPLYGYVLGLIPSLDVFIVHLIRDARGTAYSWQRQIIRKKREDDPLYRRRLSLLQCILRWNILNLLAEMLRKKYPGRYLKLRYEDFIRDPLRALESIFSMSGEDMGNIPPIANNQVELLPNHTVSGNPGRFTCGTVDLKLDDEWQVMMKPSSKAIASLLSWPLLFRYGYL